MTKCIFPRWIIKCKGASLDSRMRNEKKTKKVASRTNGVPDHEHNAQKTSETIESKSVQRFWFGL